MLLHDHCTLRLRVARQSPVFHSHTMRWACSHVNVPFRRIKSGRCLAELTAAFNGPDFSYGPISVNDVLAIEIAGRAAMGRNDFNLIADAYWLTIRQRDANVFFRSEFHHFRPRHILDSWRAPLCADPLSADIQDRPAGSRAADHGRQDRLRFPRSAER